MEHLGLSNFPIYCVAGKRQLLETRAPSGSAKGVAACPRFDTLRHHCRQGYVWLGPLKQILAHAPAVRPTRQYRNARFVSRDTASLFRHRRASRKAMHLRHRRTSRKSRDVHVRQDWIVGAHSARCFARCGGFAPRDCSSERCQHYPGTYYCSSHDSHDASKDGQGNCLKPKENHRKSLDPHLSRVRFALKDGTIRSCPLRMGLGATRRRLEDIAYPAHGVY